MIFHQTGIGGVWMLEPERRPDSRGHFARLWCAKEFEERGLTPNLAQCSYSRSELCGTLRGMHYQARPHQEAKLVRCMSGSFYDVALDLRPDSPTFKRHFGVILTPENGRMLYIPEGCAHGLLTLENGTEALYFISEFYIPEAARGVRWDDTAFAIRWPVPVRAISERDRSYEDFDN